MSQPLSQNNAEKTEAVNRARNANFIIGIFMFASALTSILFAYIGYANSQPQIYSVSILLAANVIINLWLFSLVHKGDVTLAMGIVITLFLIDVLIVPFFAQGMGLLIVASALVATMTITGLAMPSKYRLAGVTSGLLAGGMAYGLDLNLGGGRFNAPQLQAYTPYIVTIIACLLAFAAARELKNLSLRIKVALGILVTGAVTVGVLVAFGMNRSNTITTYLLNQYKNSNSDSVKQKVETRAKSSADQTNELFAALVRDINIIADYRANLEEQKEILGQGAYWDAKTRLIQLPDGQYGNSPADPASIFIPSIIELNDAILADLNTTSYFDLYALRYLENHPEVTAVYFISKSGATTYYPNTNLASQVPHDFDPRTQLFYTISNPATSSGREPKWVPAYKDPAGQGLLVTLSSPVYSNDKFIGVISIDVRLEQISKQIGNIQIGKTGYAFLVDQEGRILAMPPKGYKLFGMQAENVPIGESPKQSIIGKGSPELQKAVTRMINSFNGIEVIQVNNENLYVAFAPLYTPNYRLGIVVPEKEFTADIIVAEDETQKQVQDTLQSMIIILAILLVGAGAVSVWVGQVITNPIMRLTKTVEQIAAGDLSARASVETTDEAGRLAASFNVMSDKLKDILSNLEERISERTGELEKINEGNARRASQFEAVARVARSISSTQVLDTLLPQIVETISRQFNFYHVGIFLLDNRHEYAILVAANSEGGKKMLERDHRLLIGEKSIVGYVTSIGQPRVALNVGSDATYFNNPDLPNTNSEIALPLRIGGEIFGALDVQSVETNAFSEEDINILATLSDQVSVAIQNARSYQQSRDALAQAEKVSLQLSGQQWKHFIEQQTVAGYYFDGTDTKAIAPKDKRRAHNLSIPLILRGAHIGAIKLNSSDPNHEWTDDEITMVQAAAERASLALENARLLEESQKRAAKERAIGEISAKIGGLTDLEDIIQTAIQELGYTLPDTEIAIQFTDASAK